MRYVELVPGVPSSALGFGCSVVCGSRGKVESARAIHTALDCGVNHFDLARCYGYGDAEAFVAKNTPKKREEVVFATKFGIEATSLASALKPLKAIGRVVNRKHSCTPQSEEDLESGGLPRANPHVVSKSRLKQIIGGMLLKRRPVNARLMQLSVERSLKALRTDYIDYLFVHEPVVALEDADRIFEVAMALKKAGKLRGFGISSEYYLLKLHHEYLDRFNIIQLANSPTLKYYNEIQKEFRNTSTSFFSIFNGGRMPILHADTLTKMSKDFPRSTFICSMMNPAHIRTNADAVS